MTAKSKKVDKKILAAKVLVEQTRGVRALSHREKKVVTGVLAGVRKVDDSEVSLPEVTETTARPHVRDVLVEALAKIGVTADKLAGVLAEGLDAERLVMMGPQVQSVKDHAIRHKFLETALSVVGVTEKKGGPAVPSANVFVFRSHLGEKPVDVTVGAPTDAVVSRRLNAAKVRNRSHA